jgi:hypothetical protein
VNQSVTGEAVAVANGQDLDKRDSLWHDEFDPGRPNAGKPRSHLRTPGDLDRKRIAAPSQPFGHCLVLEVASRAILLIALAEIQTRNP